MKQSLRIHVPEHVKHDYDVFIGTGLLSDLPRLIPAHVNQHAIAIITDNTVKKLYGQPIVEAFEKIGKPVNVFSFPAGEAHKSAETKCSLESALLKKKYGRDSCIIALGGGIVGDMAGFVAATYMRGIPYVQVPTTLLAMVDSSIGGKTAINTPEGKNLIGAFWHPASVVLDLDCLETLSEPQRIAGWIEALKIFITCDASTFKEATQEAKPTALLIKKAIAWKADIVGRDPREMSVRATLNFGHTVGHALESAADYKLLHGHAVGYGMLVESYLSYQRKQLSQHELDHIIHALNALGIMGHHLQRYDLKRVLSHMRLDKKTKNSQIRCVLLQGLGGVHVSEGSYTHPVSDAEVISAWEKSIEDDHHGRK